MATRNIWLLRLFSNSIQGSTYVTTYDVIRRLAGWLYLVSKENIVSSTSQILNSFGVVSLKIYCHIENSIHRSRRKVKSVVKTWEGGAEFLISLILRPLNNAVSTVEIIHS